MIGDSIVIVHNAVNKTLLKVREQDYGAEYYLDDTATTGYAMTLVTRHTIPKIGKFGTSHMMKLSYDQFNTDGTILRTISNWGVMRTDHAVQLTAPAIIAQAAFLSAFTAANTTKLLNRES